MRVRILLLFVMCFSAPTFATSTNDDDEARRECDAHKRFSDFLVSSTTGSVTVLSFDRNGDSIADAWEYWDFEQSPPLYLSTADKNQDGRVDAWYRFNANAGPYIEIDTNYDGVVDKRVYRDGRIEADIDGDGVPNQVKRMHCFTTAPAKVQPSP